MTSKRATLFTLAATATAVLAACAMDAATSGGGEMVVGNAITGEGIPNPAPVVTANWGQLPAGRPMGTSAGAEIDPTDGHVWMYERCAQGALNQQQEAGGGFGGAVNCDSNPVDPIFKFDRNTGAVLANIGAGVTVVPHGLHVDREGNVWVTDFQANQAGTKGHQVHKFSPTGELLMSLGTPGQTGTDGAHFNQPNDVIVAPDGSIFVSDGHSGQGMTTNQAMEQGRADGQTARIMKFSPQGEFIMQWGQIGTLHGEFRTPHALAFDSQGRLWVADRGNHRLEIFDQNGNYLDSRYQHGRISGIFITDDDMVYSIDSESSPTSHPNWMNGVRIGPVDRDVIVGFIPPFPADTRPYQGAAGEGIAVDADGNVFAAEGPNSLRFASGPFTRYSVR
jgi:DNA-binding beta-propeller fold protein YncE